MFVAQLHAFLGLSKVCRLEQLHPQEDGPFSAPKQKVPKANLGLHLKPKAQGILNARKSDNSQAQDVISDDDESTTNERGGWLLAQVH